jgi:NADPH:quinone reductase-like Zn-dependent oxidoreductase
MKAWQLHDFGIENLRLERLAVPTPKPHEVLIRVRAVSLNYRDKAVLDGQLGAIALPLTPVADVAGEVVALGTDVTAFRIGDRVLSHLWSHWLEGDAAPDGYKYLLGSALQGGLSEYMLLEAQSIIRIPAAFTFAEASTFPTAALTAWFALVSYGKLQADETVLVQGTGGVSIFGIQIAHLLGARVIVTTSSDEKGEQVRKLGADEVINYRKTPDWVAEAQRLTQGQGVHHILEVVGGDGLNESVKALRYNGRISIIGFLASPSASLDLIALMVKQVRLQGIAVGHLRALETMVQTFAEKGVKPLIEQVYSFDQAVAAYTHLAKGSLGKIVIAVA